MSYKDARSLLVINGDDPDELDVPPSGQLGGIPWADLRALQDAIDPTHPNYAERIVLALRCWSEVYGQRGRIESAPGRRDKWLRKHMPGETSSMIKTVATVATPWQQTVISASKAGKKR